MDQVHILLSGNEAAKRSRLFIILPSKSVFLKIIAVVKILIRLVSRQLLALWILWLQIVDANFGRSTVQIPGTFTTTSRPEAYEINILGWLVCRNVY